MTIHDLYIKAIEAVNAAQPDNDSQERAYRKGILDCAEAMGMNVGALLMSGDMHYLDQGIDRPMCGGVFLSKDTP